MRIHLPEGAFHHAGKTPLALFVPGVILDDIRGRNLAFEVASIVLLAAAGVIWALSLLHSHHADDCRKCHPLPNAALARPHRRALAWYSRQGWIPVGITVVIFGLTASFLPVAHDRTTRFQWGLDGALLFVAVVLMLHVSAVRFRVLNRPDITPHKPLRALIDGPGRKLRHKGHWLYLAAMAIVLPICFAPDSGIWSAIQFMGILLLYVAQALDTRHGETLCEECVSEFPINAEEYAARRKWRFTVMHRWSFIPSLGVLGVIVSSTVWDRPISTYALAVSFIIGGTYVVNNRFHGAYQPWCPYCNGGGGGGGESEEVPDPADGHGRPVPVA
jgi:hypothetical protein